MENQNQQPRIIIGGPTASGKTAAALAVARACNGMLISADSRQIYNHVRIGTNTGPIVECTKNKVIMPSHLREEKVLQHSVPIYTLEDIPVLNVSFFSLFYDFSVYLFQKLLPVYKIHIKHQNALPVIVGGTGLYIDAIIKSYHLDIESNDDIYLSVSEGASTEELLRKLPTHIMSELNSSEKRNKRRLLRIFEKLKIRGVSQETYQTLQKGREDTTEIPTLFLYPEYDRKNLMKSIEERVEEMVDTGLVEEAEMVRDLTNDTSPLLKGTGYKEVVQFLQKEISKDKMISRIKIGHRHYAKRQITWFEGKGRGYKLTKFRTPGEAAEITREWLESVDSSYSL